MISDPHFQRVVLVCNPLEAARLEKHFIMLLSRLSRISPANIKISSRRANVLFNRGRRTRSRGSWPTRAKLATANIRDARDRQQQASRSQGPRCRQVLKKSFLKRNEFIWLRFPRETTTKTLLKDDALFRKRVEQTSRAT